MGLPLVKRLVDLMGGNLSLSSQEGEGTAVYVSLPFQLAQTLQTYKGTEQEQDIQPRFFGYKILVADDDQTTQFGIKDLLEKLGFWVQVVDNGRDVVFALADQYFDCVLMDIQMPVLDGVEASKRIRNSEKGYKDVPIIAMTAYAMQGDKEKFLDCGIDDYIAKPVDIKDLQRVLEHSAIGKTEFRD